MTTQRLIAVVSLLGGLLGFGSGTLFAYFLFFEWLGFGSVKLSALVAILGATIGYGALKRALTWLFARTAHDMRRV